jgi:aspartate 1-decarboxylase
MRRRMMKSKIHRATVTDANLDYVGSISLDPRLMELADIVEYEQVAVLDIDNGARFETYAIVGGPGEVCLNGAAARLVHKGDKVIVLTYADYEDAELEHFVPRIVHVDSSNTPTSIVDDSRAVDDSGTDDRLRARLDTRLDSELSGIGIS